MKYGVILMRAQPVHKGHMEVVKQALEENDNVLIVVGSANKEGTKRNPFPIGRRVGLIKNALDDCKLPDAIRIMTLSDWSMEDAYQYAKEWGSFFYYNVVNEIQEKTFTLYYNDDPEIARNWFVPEIAERITIKNAKRKWDVSGTRVREAIIKLKLEYLVDVLTASTFNQVTTLRNILKECNKEDHMMD